MEWWHLCFVAVMVFLGLLFTNYLIKKINEARIEERYARIAERRSTNQGTQIQEIVQPLRTTEGNQPPSVNGPKSKISLIFDKDDNIQQDYRTRIVSALSNKVRSDELQDIKEVEKAEDCTAITILKKQASIITNTMAMKSIIIKECNDCTLRPIVLPTSDTSSKTSHNAEASLSQNIELLLSKVTHETERTLSKVKSNIVQNNNISPNDNAIKPSSHELQIPITQEETRERLSHSIVTKELLLPETCEMASKKNVIDTNISEILRSEFQVSEISQAPVINFAEKNNNSSLITSNTSVKVPETPENIPGNDSKVDDSCPSTTVGLVMLQVYQKVDNPLYHNTNHLINEKLDNIKIIANSSTESTAVQKTNDTRSLSSNSSQERNNIPPKHPKPKHSFLAEDGIGTITSAVSEPQTSKIKQNTENTLKHKLSNTSQVEYHHKLKNFSDGNS